MTQNVRRIFFSDVHLSPDAPHLSRRLISFLQREAPRTDEFYILGDLFNYWLGPRHFDLGDYDDVLAEIGRIVKTGRRVVFLHGNRDFYFGSSFHDRYGVETHRGLLRCDFEGLKVCLCHGDMLCTHDWAHTLFTLIFRCWPVEKILTSLPIRLARFLARGYRNRSKRTTSRKTARELSPADSAVANLFRRDADVIVCGHVHHMALHRYTIDDAEKLLYALGSWDEGESYLTLEAGRWQMHSSRRQNDVPGRCVPPDQCLAN